MDCLFLVTSVVDNNEVKSHGDDMLGLIERDILFYINAFMKHLGDFSFSLESSWKNVSLRSSIGPVQTREFP